MISNQAKKPTKNKVLVDLNPIEQIKGLGSDVIKSASNDLVVGVARSIVDQIFNTPKNPNQPTAGQNAEIKPNQSVQSVNLTESEIRKDERQRIELFKRQTEAPIFSYRKVEISRQIQEIQLEIKRIISTSREVEITIANAVLQPLPERPGEYHLSFFELILKLIKDARLKVEESKTWLSLFISKKKCRNYWSMFKKHGTSFGMSNERSVAMSSG